MPFDGPPWLADEEMLLIEQWIAQGARDSEGRATPVPAGARVRFRGAEEGGGGGGGGGGGECAGRARAGRQGERRARAQALERVRDVQREAEVRALAAQAHRDGGSRNRPRASIQVVPSCSA